MLDHPRLCIALIHAAAVALINGSLGGPAASQRKTFHASEEMLQSNSCARKCRPYAASSQDVSDAISAIRWMTTNSVAVQNRVDCWIVVEIVPASG
jgi:hypothetical protein